MQGVLHGTWVTESPSGGNFIIWVEILSDIQKIASKAQIKDKSRKKKSKPSIHPYCTDKNNLMKIIDILFSHVDQSEFFIKKKFTSQFELLCPTSNNIPIPSPELIELAK